MKLARKIIFIFLSFLVLSLSLIFPTKTVFAQNQVNYNWYSQPPMEWYLKVYDDRNPQEIFGERYTAAQVQWVLYSIPSVLTNLIFGQNTKLVSCGMLAITGKTADVKTCLEGSLDIFREIAGTEADLKLANEKKESIISSIFKDRELSGITYVKRLASKFKVIPQAQAADEGFGFGALGPLTRLWRISRNFAYAIFTIAIIVFSFMIMFRVKINPQTVVTIQSTLPKIAIAMVLVTFSYAIAGFMVDLVYVVIAFITTLIHFAEPVSGGPTFLYHFMIGEIDFKIFIIKGFFAILAYFVFYLILYFCACIAAGLAIATSLSANAFGSAIVAILLWAFSLVLFFILVFNFVKLIAMLFQTVAKIYMTVILGPLQIALGVLVPGMGFGSWLKSLLSKLAVFPILGVLFWLAFRLITDSYLMSLKIILEDNIIFNTIENWFRLFGGGVLVSDTVTKGFAWEPPFLGGGTLPIIFILMSLSCIMIIPKIAKAIESFMAGRGFEFESAIGESMGPLKTAGGWVSKEATERGTPQLAKWVRDYMKTKGLQQRSGGKYVYDFLNTVARSGEQTAQPTKAPVSGGVQRPGAKK